MNVDKIMALVLYYTLFKNTLFEEQLALPNNAFGIFSTIRRNIKLAMYPYDIYGCIGYYTRDFNILSQQDLQSNMLTVGHNSLWLDDRRHYHPSIQLIPESMLELDFMLYPIYFINSIGIIDSLNVPFNNVDFGIIIQTNKTKVMNSATYLPGVFPDMSFQDIIPSLKRKAGIHNDSYTIYAYKIKQIKASFISILNNEYYSKYTLKNYVNLMLSNVNLNNRYPFFYMKQGNSYLWNDTDDVRNIATLSAVYTYILYLYLNITDNISIKNKIISIKNKIINITENISEYSSQALSFLGSLYPKLKLHNMDFCIKLLRDLPTADLEFAQPEIIIGLHSAQCDMSIIPLDYDSHDSIFKLNWLIQAHLYLKASIPKELIRLMNIKIKELLPNLKTTETNYLAVAFEALCCAKTLTTELFILFYELEQRKSGNLYHFLNKTARVDITGHILNGLYNNLNIN